MSGKMGRSGRKPGIYAGDGDVLQLPALERLPEKPMFASEAASQLWDDVAETLYEEKKLTLVDLALLQSTCELWGLYRDSFQCAVANPIDKDARIAVTAYWAKFEQGAARFGMNPSDRQKIRANKPVKSVIPARQRG